MITIESLTQFFGWCSVINIALLTFTTLIILILRGPILTIHSKLFNIKEDKLQLLYIQFIALYKIAIIMLNVTPYIALKLML